MVEHTCRFKGPTRPLKKKTHPQQHTHTHTLTNTHKKTHEARPVIQRVLSTLKSLPPTHCQDIVQHTHDIEVVCRLTGRSVSRKNSAKQAVVEIFSPRKSPLATAAV